MRDVLPKAELLVAVALAGLAAWGCSPAHVRPDASLAASSARADARLSADIADCSARAQQALKRYRDQRTRPTLTSVANLGVGMAVIVAEARAAEAVRREAFSACMRRAGWELHAQR